MQHGTKPLNLTKHTKPALKKIAPIIFIFLMFFHANGQPKAEKSDRIKLARNIDTSLVHFQSGDYIISFQSKDLDRIYNKLEIPDGFQTKDTLDFLKYIQSINATGKGNWTNNYRFNILLREIIDKGDIKVY